MRNSNYSKSIGYFPHTIFGLSQFRFVGSDHDMVMMTFQTRLKNSRKPTQPRIRFDFEKLNDLTVMSAFRATIGGRFAPLATLVDEDADLDSMVTQINP